jgi:hypothetical protein
MNISVTFEFEGKQYKGEFSQVSGSGNIATFHLMVDKLYWGQLSYIEEYKGISGVRGMEPREAHWRFSSNTKAMEHFAEDFGRIVLAALESAV